MKHTIYIYVFFLCSCANVIAPSGGPKDTEAPRLLETFPENNTRSFNQSNIIFVFDENIEVNEINNILISPYTTNSPKISVNKNKLKLEFEEKLLPNTTYLLSLDDVQKMLMKETLLTN